ncbi:MAG: hypothetical protein LBN95_05300 [Prevotellaceae bacterium]|jgi:hypothetical protein|nr:hypothetical protein [Prevotellaceae bacterium]
METKTSIYGNLPINTLFTNKMLLSVAMSNPQKSLKDLRGKVSFSENYDYKSMRV